MRSEKVKIAEILDIQTGFQVRNRFHFDSQGNYNIIQVKNTSESLLHYMKPNNLDKIHIPKNRRSTMDKYLLKKEDILYLSKLHFKAFRYMGDLENTAPMSHFYILRPTKPINSDYLCWILNQSSIKSHIQGSLLPFISKKALMNIEIPLPREETQKKISQILRLRAKEIEMQKAIDQKKTVYINKVLTHIL